MKRIISLCCCTCCLIMLHAQVKQLLDRRITELEADTMLRHAIIGLTVVDAINGVPLYTHHDETGLAPASTQKIFTAIAAFETFGHDFKFETKLSYMGRIEHGRLIGSLIIRGSGDPTFGSWRWNETKPTMILNQVIRALRARGISSIDGDLVIDESGFELQPTPDGWIWQDIGNYYGAGSWSLNWHENQYDLNVKPGSAEGDSTQIVSTDPLLAGISLRNRLRTGKAGSGDNGYIYLAPFAVSGFVTGTVPAGKTFSLSGAFPDPPKAFGTALVDELNKQHLPITGNVICSRDLPAAQADFRNADPILILQSPPLDSVIHWFLRKSINLYGESLLKLLATRGTAKGSTTAGVDQLKSYWSARSIEPTSLAIMDGSGLSPQNRVTTNAEVSALLFAKRQSWFSSFYDALPEYNGMKMKSGSINGSRAFAGYHRAANGKEYVFSIIVNNYSGSATAMVRKMFNVLDVLK